ncbi:MAG: hypothetical protein ACYCT2_07470 [Thermoplasmataceae archaeon]
MEGKSNRRVMMAKKQIFSHNRGPKHSTEYYHHDFIEAMEDKRSFWRSELNPVIIGKIPDVDIVVKEVAEVMSSIVSKNST